MTWNCKPIHPFLPKVSLGQGVFSAATDMKQGQPVNRLAAHLSQARNTLDNQRYCFPPESMIKNKQNTRAAEHTEFSGKTPSLILRSIMYFLTCTSEFAGAYEEKVQRRRPWPSSGESTVRLLQVVYPSVKLEASKSRHRIHQNARKSVTIPTIQEAGQEGNLIQDQPGQYTENSF